MEFYNTACSFLENKQSETYTLIRIHYQYIYSIIIYFYKLIIQTRTRYWLNHDSIFLLKAHVGVLRENQLKMTKKDSYFSDLNENIQIPVNTTYIII